MPDFAAWTPGSWSALAAWFTATVAVAAGGFALQQVREARRLREEQSQPYVVAYMELSEASAHLIDLVVRNFGSTAAYEVTLQVDPHPKRTVQGAGDEEVWLFDRLPVLVPGQEWRTLWDFGPERAKRNLPDMHEAIVTYEDSKRRKLPPLQCQLDWTPYQQRRWAIVYGSHDAAKALREINKKMAKWQENIHGGLAVFVRDGDASDAERRREYEEMLAQRRNPDQEDEV